jgi:peptidoglycan/LPS O-acetylase OafA/YrhL
VGGYLGVDVFFVISGFLITALLLRERAETGGIRLGAFWLRRARRLLPALGLLLLVCCAAALPLGGDRLLNLPRQVLGALSFSSNWLSVAAGASYYDASAPELFRNLWSLAVEEQFYLLWPFVVLLIAFLPGRVLRIALLLLAALASAAAMASLYRPDVDPTRVYYGTDTHSFGLALGAALAMLARDWPAQLLAWPRIPRMLLPAVGWLALAGLLVLGVGMTDDASFPYQGGLALVALLTAVVIAGAIVPGSSLGASLDIAPMRWIGDRSYGLYLWHWPVWVLLTDALRAAEPTWLRSPWVIGGIAAVLTFAAAAISYRFVEQPVRRRGFRATLARWATPWRHGVRTVVAVVASLALVLGLGTASALALVSDPGETELEQQLAAAQARIAAANAAKPQPLTEEAAPALPSGDRILAIGDSVMLAASPQLQEQFPGIWIDATVSRSMFVAPDLVQSIVDSGGMRDVLVIGLGTNGPVDEQSLEAVRAIVGPDIEIVLVNVQAPRDWTEGVNAELSSFAQRYRQVELANWQAAIAPSIGELAPDEIHPGGPLTGGIYCDALRDALQRLAELPPLRTDDDYGDLSRPV